MREGSTGSPSLQGTLFADEDVPLARANHGISGPQRDPPGNIVEGWWRCVNMREGISRA